MKYFLFFFILFFTKLADAFECPVDVHGTKKISAEWVCQTFEKEIENLIAAIKKDNFSQIYESNGEEIDFEEILKKIKEIKKIDHIFLSPIIYHDHRIFITLDVIENSSKQLTQFLSEPQDTISNVDGLLDVWNEYQQIGGKLSLTDKNFKGFKACPAYHCLFGFEDPRLKKYGPLFIEHVPLVKKELISVLKFDKDPQKRGTAAYLLAHIQDPNELASILTPQIYDSSPYVRNSVLRVLSSLLSAQKIDDFPKDPIIDALDFPILTDRNKALSVLAALAQNPENHHYILQKAGPYLIDNLKMKQPNLHDFAYTILVLISGKNFEERDYAQWEQWISPF